MARRSFSASMADQTSTRFIPASTMPKCSSTPSICSPATGMICGSFRFRWQGQFGAAPGPPHRGHLHRPIRTRRDRPGPVSGGLQHGSRGSGIEAPGSSLSWRTVATLDQGEEPAAPCDGSGHGVIQMTTLDKLLAQKQELMERLQQEDIGPEERDEIERLLERIEVALDLLDKAGPSRR